MDLLSRWILKYQWGKKNRKNNGKSQNWLRAFIINSQVRLLNILSSKQLGRNCWRPQKLVKCWILASEQCEDNICNSLIHHWIPSALAETWHTEGARWMWDWMINKSRIHTQGNMIQSTCFSVISNDIKQKVLMNNKYQ